MMTSLRRVKIDLLILVPRSQFFGEVAEWSNAAVSKAVVPLVGTGGSNPPLSAKVA
jgi:hypothetical protein